MSTGTTQHVGEQTEVKHLRNGENAVVAIGQLAIELISTAAVGNPMWVDLKAVKERLAREHDQQE